jgi:hypothetical protein
MCDLFQICSGRLKFTHYQPDNDWLIDDQDSNVSGTVVRTTISQNSTTTVQSVFERYAPAETLSFSRTHVPVRLAQYDQEDLISRSQAKRVLARFERFEEVMLDFEDVEFIGQAFADEIFRVYKNSHPNIKIVAVNTSGNVDAMIRRVVSGSEIQLRLFE